VTGPHILGNMGPLASWPVLGTLGAGVANLLLLRYVWPWRDEPGGRWFVVVIGVQTFWCLAYGAALLTFDPALRYALEVAAWLPANWLGVCFLAFALEYTGRIDLRRALWFKLTVAFEAVSTLVVVTNPLHGLVWTDFAVAPQFGAATAAYTHEPWVYVQFVALFVQSLVGSLVLLDTVVSYGPLFRRQAIAIALTPLYPGVAFAAWTFEVAPVYPLNLTPIMFLPHAMLDVYALFRSDMFEFPPTTRRTGERAAIDDIGTPVVIVDVKGRVVTLNPSAAATFEADKHAVQADPMDDIYEGDSVDLSTREQALGLRTAGERREFDVTVTPLADAADSHVGYTVTFQDVTAERQRRQRLSVLNRILRHNLRNDLAVVRSYADHVAETVDDETATEAVSVIDEQSADLLELGEKARRASEALDGGADQRVVGLATLVDEVAADLREEHPDGAVTVDVPPDLRLESNPRGLELVVRSLVENGIEHGGGTVEVAATGTADGGRSVLLAVRDDGPGLPDHEREVIEGGEESALAHGSGLGLWLARWGATALGGDVSFETPEGGGTTVHLRLPGVVEGTAADAPAGGTVPGDDAAAADGGPDDG
jgi:signal transduction histidine kinase